MTAEIIQFVPGLKPNAHERVMEAAKSGAGIDELNPLIREAIAEAKSEYHAPPDDPA